LDIDGKNVWPGYSLTVAEANTKFETNYSTLPEASFLKGACLTKAAVPASKKMEFVLSIGGWGRSNLFSKTFASDSARTNFITDAKFILSNFKCADGKPLFDGIDIDWEYPIRRIDFVDGVSQSPQDAANFHKVIIDLRKAIGPDKILSIALPHGNSPANKELKTNEKGQVISGTITSDEGALDNYFIDADGKPLADNKEFIGALNTFNIMSYDFMAFVPKTTTQAPMSRAGTNAGNTQTIVDGINILNKWGVPDDKILLGLAAYGRAIVNQSSGGTCVPDTASSTNDLGLVLPVITDTNGTEVPCEITWPAYKDLLVNNIAEAHSYGSDVLQYGYHWFNKPAGSANLIKPQTTITTQAGNKTYIDTASNGYFTFDAPDTIAGKINYVNTHKLAGVFFWELSQDSADYMGNVTISGKSYPVSLVKTAQTYLDGPNKPVSGPCAGIPNWEAQEYPKTGTLVVYNNNKYQSLWWTTPSDIPGTAGGPWKEISSCTTSSAHKK
jgi:GH18 family chitinase